VNKGVTFAQYLEMYLAHRKCSLAPRFFTSVETVLRSLLLFLDVTYPSQVKTACLQKWADEKLLSIKPASVASYLQWSRLFFQWCVSRKILRKDPTEGVLLPRVRKPFRRNFLSKEQVHRLISGCRDDELKYCLYCGFHAGLRLNEVVMSRPEWFDLQRGLLHITQGPNFETKDRDDRTVPLTDEFREFLFKYGLRAPYMIAPNKITGKVYRVYFRKRFLHYVSTFNGINLSFHDCRRTFASLLASEGVSIYKISKWLGDGVQVVERHYSHLVPQDPEINRINLSVEQATAAALGIDPGEPEEQAVASWEDLYQLVWSMPMTKAARSIGISDVGLRKRCIRLEIPIPPVGYWNLPPSRRQPAPLLLPATTEAA